MYSFLLHRCRLSPEEIANLTFSQVKVIFSNYQKDGKPSPVSYDEAVRQIAEYRAEQ